MRKLFLISFILISLTMNLYCQVSRNGMEIDSVVIWADSPKDSIDYVNKMNEKYPDAGVMASCMGVMEFDMGIKAPEVIIMNIGEINILFVNICSMDTIITENDNSEHRNDLPPCMVELKKIFENEIEDTPYFQLMENIIVNDKEKIKERVIRYNKFMTQIERDTVNFDTLINIFDKIKKIGACDKKRMIEVLKYTDSSQYRSMVMYALANSLNDEEVMSAFFTLIVNKFEHNAIQFVSKYFASLNNSSYLINDGSLKRMVKSLIKIPKSNAFELADVIYPKIKDIKLLFDNVNKDDFSVLIKYLKFNIRPEPTKGILKPLLGVDFVTSKEYIDYIEKMEK